MKAGDRVQFLNENDEGVVASVLTADRVMVTNSDGFDIEVAIKDLILKDDECSNDLLIQTVHIEQQIFRKENKKQHQGEDFWDHVYTIDLHIEEIISDHRKLNGFEMLMSQLSYLKDKIGEVQRKGLTEFVVIHGVGTGALRAEVAQILSLDSDFVYDSASATKYGDGATLVQIKS